jgi:hypothetical protein
MRADGTRSPLNCQSGHAICAGVFVRSDRECELPYASQMIQSTGVTLTRWRRSALDAVITIAPPVLLLAFLVAYDDRVREQLSLRVAPERATQALVAAGSTWHSLTSVLAEAGRDQTIAHAPLLIFSMAAAVLTLFMVRT